MQLLRINGRNLGIRGVEEDEMQKNEEAKMTLEHSSIGRGRQQLSESSLCDVRRIF